MTDVVIYFGRPGALTTIPHPRGGVVATRDRPTSVFRTGTGGARTGKLAGGARRYILEWETLDLDTFSTLLAYDQGHQGPGPFVLLDPGQRNQLTVNQSSATSETNDTDNFTVSGSGYSLTSESTVYRRGPRALKVSIAYASQAGTVTLDPPATDWYGVPVVSRALVFSFYAKGGGSDPVVTLVPQLVWYSAAGAVLSTSTGTPTPTTSASWTQMTVTASPPATAAFVQPGVATSASTISASAALYLDELQLEEGSTPGAWRPGTGTGPVQVVSLFDEWPFYQVGYRTRPVMVLQEVGP